MTELPPKKTILVVEDDEAVRNMLVRALGVQYAVIAEEDGVEAMERLKKLSTPPDLVITDVMMPKMNGYALARMLGADPRYRAIPIIFLTARTTAKDVAVGISAGARHYIAKPFGLRDVLDKVGRILR